jgi:thioesterase domain-containing protein/acyl carrier protein
VVREQIAVVLGLDSPSEIDPERSFLEIGFDSLSALELRNRLSETTGLQLPPSVAFDHPSPQDVARYVLDQVEVSGAPEGDGGTDVMVSLFREADRSGRAEEFMKVLDAAASFRPTFAAAREVDALPAPARLAQGSEHPCLVCLPSVIASAGPHEYARLIRGLPEGRDAVALPWPGFTTMEPMPASWEVAVEMQARALEESCDGDPFILLGHSTGGAFAHALARHLEAVGRSPAGVVLIDSYHPSQDARGGDIGAGILAAMLWSGGSSIELDDLRMTAMSHYLRLVADLETGKIAAPVLMVQATEPIGDIGEGASWQPHWPTARDTVEVPGDHLSMMAEHAGTTAAAIAPWLTATADAYASARA